MSFLDSLRLKHASMLFPEDKILSFLGTTSSPGYPPALAAMRIANVVPTPARDEIEVHLRGALPRALGKGECATVSLISLVDGSGFQLKTYNLLADSFAKKLYEQRDGLSVLKTRNVFNVQHGPNTTDFYPVLPIKEVLAVAEKARCAIVGVGEQANVSPRFIFDHRANDGAIELVHAEVKFAKTFVNLQRNPVETRLIIDFDTLQGYCLTGKLEAVAPEQLGAVATRIQDVFGRVGFGKPTRYWRLRAQEWSRFTPIA